MAVVVRKASRKKAKLRLGIAAPSGGGKTVGALLVAFGITGDWSKVGLIDTEQGSGELYVGQTFDGVKIGEYNYVGIEPDYTVKKYIEAQKALEEVVGNEGVVITDSTSHAWAGKGGLLDKQGAAAHKSGNSYTAWREVTPDHNNLVDSWLSSPAHIICTMRSKQEYVQEKNEQGKTVVRKVGMAPVQREGLEYEFSVMVDVDVNHQASVSKDRTGLFDGRYFKLNPAIGRELKEWLETGIEAPKPRDWTAEAKEAAEAFKSASTAFELDDYRKHYAAMVAELKELPGRALYSRLVEVYEECSSKFEEEDREQLINETTDENR